MEDFRKRPSGSLASTAASRSIGRAIVVGGLLAGALDLAWAVAQSVAQGRSPSRMLQSIASGVLGSSSYEAGPASMVLGVLLHFAIALGAAATYALASRLWPAIHRRYLVAGALFGVGVYFVMHFVVLPLSRIPWQLTLAPLGLALGLSAHILCVGLPIAWAAWRHAE